MKFARYFTPALLAFAVLAAMYQAPGINAAPTPQPVPVAQPDDAPAEVRSEFRKALVDAIQEGVREGKLTRAEGWRLRLASFSPAFQQRAQELCVVQMVFSGENQDAIPFNDDGTVNKTAIDWEGLTEFLKAILPILLELLLSLGIGG